MFLRVRQLARHRHGTLPTFLLRRQSPPSCSRLYRASSPPPLSRTSCHVIRSRRLIHASALSRGISQRHLPMPTTTSLLMLMWPHSLRVEVCHDYHPFQHEHRPASSSCRKRCCGRVTEQHEIEIHPGRRRDLPATQHMNCTPLRPVIVDTFHGLSFISQICTISSAIGGTLQRFSFTPLFVATSYHTTALPWTACHGSTPTSTRQVLLDHRSLFCISTRRIATMGIFHTRAAKGPRQTCVLSSLTFQAHTSMHRGFGDLGLIIVTGLHCAFCILILVLGLSLYPWTRHHTLCTNPSLKIDRDQHR